MSSTEKSTSKFPWPIPNGNVGEYQLHCHCGAIRYTMKLSPPLYASETTLAAPERYEAVECDCSQCERHGIWAAHPFIKDVHFAEGVSGEQWERGSELRKEYRCGGKVNPHYFCPECGSVLATDLTALMKNVMKVPKGEERMTINVRMLKDFDRKKIQVRRVEGMSKYPPQYAVE